FFHTTASPVAIVDFAFNPTTVRITAGDAVVWKNGGLAPHTVSAKDGSFDSGIIDPGTTFQRVFAREGSYAYLCKLHPNMAGTVLVGAATRAPTESPATTSTTEQDASSSPDARAAAIGRAPSDGTTMLGPGAVVGMVVGLPAVLVLGMTWMLRRNGPEEG
ncbi:MAG TPA: plastocyanin/azurin family copper-binding protein, partial [Actinomycetota bacterium]|nr:plastocyanin/azurin family copper-binding protein [Actinomycetota bacterium]